MVMNVDGTSRREQGRNFQSNGLGFRRYWIEIYSTVAASAELDLVLLLLSAIYLSRPFDVRKMRKLRGSPQLPISYD